MEAFHLPKYQHIVAEYSTDALPSAGARGRNAVTANTAHKSHIPTILDPMVEDLEDDVAMDEVLTSVPQLKAYDYVAGGGVPMSMQELADAAQQRSLDTSASTESEHPNQTSTLISTTDAPSKAMNGIGSNGSSGSRVKLTVRARGSAKKRTREETEKPSPATKRVKVSSVSTPVPTPTRVLRPRPSKSTTQLAEEREREHAYRKAVAE